MINDQHLSASGSPKGGRKVFYPWPLPGPDVPQQLGLLGLCGGVVVPHHGHGTHRVLADFHYRAGQGSKENRESRKHKLTESLDSRENKQREPGENTEGCFYLRKVVHDELLEGLVRDPVIAIQHGLKSGNGSPRSLPGIKGLKI